MSSLPRRPDGSIDWARVESGPGPADEATPGSPSRRSRDHSAEPSRRAPAGARPSNAGPTAQRRRGQRDAVDLEAAEAAARIEAEAAARDEVAGDEALADEPVADEPAVADAAVADAASSADAGSSGSEPSANAAASGRERSTTDAAPAASEDTAVSATGDDPQMPRASSDQTPSRASRRSSAAASTTPPRSAPAAASALPGGSTPPAGSMPAASSSPPAGGTAPDAGSVGGIPPFAPDETAVGGDGPPPPPRRRSGPVRGQALLVARAAILAAVIVGVVVAQAGGPATSTVAPSASPPSASAPVATQPTGFLVSTAELKDRVALARQGTEPYASALADLLTWGQTAVGTAPAPVSPLVVVGTENILVDDATRAYGLGLAYVATGDEAYATAARRTIRAWVDDVKSTADTCTDNGGCNTSLILGRVAPGFIFGADLIRTSPSWSAADTKALQDWLRTVILPAASERPNNWGDAGTFLRIAIAEYIGDDAEFDAAVTKWRSLLDLVEPDGRIPEESRRGQDGISYTQEALQYKVAAAQLAERRGVNLWDAVGSQGGSLKVSLDRLAFYVRHPAEWPDATDPEVPDPGPAWEIAYAHWHDPAWVEFVQAARPYGDAGHSAIRWTTLTNGVPIDDSAGAASPSPSSATTSSVVRPTTAARTPAATAPVIRATPPPPPTAAPSVVAGAPGLASLQVGLVATAAPGDLRFRVAWSAPEPGTVAIDASASGGWNPLLESSRASGTAIFSRPEGSFSVRGRVLGDGGTSEWLELGGVRAERIDAGPDALALSGSWETARADAYSGGEAASTNQSGASATWTGTASGLLVIGPVGPTRGSLGVYVDGSLTTTVPLRAPRFAARRVLAALTWPGTTSHEVVLKALDSTGGGSTVAVDELVRLEGGSVSSTGSGPTG